MKKFLFTLASFLFFISATYANKYYWVGGSGNWNDYATHWATASGGTEFQIQVPSSVDSVYFDANSFTGAGQTVTLNVLGTCATMDWTGVTNTPTISGTNLLEV